MEDWFIYLIRTNVGHLYTGISTDVERRLQEHRAGAPKGAKSLRGKGPLSLAYSAKVGNRSEASILEARVKKLDKKSKEELVLGQLDLAELLS